MNKFIILRWWWPDHLQGRGYFEMIQNALNIIESFRQGGLKVGISSGMLFFEDSSSGD